jgi:hypothetical protein
VAFICGAVNHALSAASSISASGNGALHSLEEYKSGITAFHTVFPDLHFTVEDRGLAD